MMDEKEHFNKKTTIQVTYIDNVFILWTGSALELKKWVQKLNHNVICLMFTYKWNNEQLLVLDVRISKIKVGGLITTIHCKPTSTNDLLRWESCHLVPLKKWIPKGKYLRLRRNYYNMEEFLKQSWELKIRFWSRGYPTKMLTKVYTFGLIQRREEILIPK